MNVQQILDRVALMIHHDLTNEQLIGQMNELTKKLFRKFPVPEAIYGFITTEMPYYTLPENCSEDRIRCVVINDVEYIKLNPEIQNPPSCFVTVFLGSLFIHPNPVGRDAYLFYGQRPDTLTANDLTAIPNFPEDYHDLYVYDTAAWVAGIQRDVDMKNNFSTEYDDILKDATRDLKKMGLRRVKETTIW